MKTLNIMSLDFTYKTSIRGYESVIIQRIWNGIDTLSMTLNAQITNSNLINVDDIMWFDTEYHKAFIVEKIDEVLSGSTIDYKIFAVGINSLLKDYISVPPVGQEFDIVTADRETIVRTWVYNNCINSSLADRNQYPIVLGTNENKGSIITDSTRYTNLSSEISRVLSPDDLSYSMTLDIQNKKIIFNVKQGINRTSTQFVNSKILFGLKYGNISEYNKVIDKRSEKNIIYVGGKGTGASRTIQIVSAATGRRKEMFLNASSIEDANLIEKGNQALSENVIVNTYEFETLERQYKYQIDYDLGDYVTVVIDKDNYEHLQIKQIDEIYEKGNIKTVSHFGKTEKTITNTITTTANRLSVLETSESAKIKDTTTDTTTTWSSEKINTTVATHETTPNWITPTYQNGWVDYDTTYNTTQYYKDKHNFVHIKGMVKNGTANSTIFTLPVGYRPARRYLFVTISNGAIGRVDVLPDGQVMMQSGSNAWFSLDIINFRAEQ